MRVRPTNLIALLAMPAIPAAVAPFCAQWHWTLDLFACFPVQAMLVLLSAATCLGFARRFRFALPYALFGLVAAAAVVPGWWAATPPTRDGAAVRVATINLLRENDASDALLAAQLRERDPDVVFFAEVTPAWAEKLQRQLPWLPHRLVVADEGWFGIALFARWPLRAPSSIPLGYAWAPAIATVVATPHGELGVLGVHTPRPGDGRREIERDRALAAIPAALRALPAATVLLGDCNATPWTPAFTAMRRAAGLGAGTTRDHHPTWPANFPWPLRIPIDHVLGTPAVDVVDAEVGDSFASDHLPLFATVRFAGDRR